MGKYAETQIKQANALIEQAKQAHADGQEQQAQQLLAQAEQINQDWGEQGKLRIGLHTVISGLTGGAAGAAGSLTGSLSAVEASRLLKENGITQENNPALYNTLVTLANSAAGGVVGGTAGAGTAFNEVTNNWSFTEKENEAYKKAKAECGPANKAACDTKKSLEDLSFKRLAASEPLKESHPEAVLLLPVAGGATVSAQATLGSKAIGSILGAGVNAGYQASTLQPGQSMDWSSVLMGGAAGWWTTGASRSGTVGFNTLTSYVGSVAQGQDAGPGMAGPVIGSIIGYKAGVIVKNKLNEIVNPWYRPI
ncbi:hypothetical protein [Aquitalea pelogenes]|uniref:hypothetical protein n=1 Tax=Aquitalea pelogenes TaxID=1293573 RepID=UPI0035B2B155